VLRSYFLLNIVLIILAGFLAYKLYDSLSAPLNLSTEPVLKQALPGEPDRDETVNPLVRKGATDFQIIVQKDLFRPDRTELKVEEKAPGTDPPPAPAVPPPKLVGIVITESNSRAYFEDPKTGVARAYRINDSISGFTLSGIEAKRVVLLRGGEKVEVKLGGTKTSKPSRRSSVSGAGPGRRRPARPLPPLYIPPKRMTAP
jgi:hypothetical protein